MSIASRPLADVEQTLRDVDCKHGAALSDLTGGDVGLLADRGFVPLGLG